MKKVFKEVGKIGFVGTSFYGHDVFKDDECWEEAVVVVVSRGKFYRLKYGARELVVSP